MMTSASRVRALLRARLFVPGMYKHERRGGNGRAMVVSYLAIDSLIIVHQYLGDLGAREFGWWGNTLSQHLSDLGA